ncbi:MAG: response regulator transcription factor [Pseudomonadales bacterium]|nr:response regulator transcription factor [Pseudomonadales bacterium]
MISRAECLRVMLVDDHEVVRAGYRLLLENIADIEVVAELASGEEANSQVMTVKPDVIIMDLSMPGMGGLEAIRRIRAKQADARILVFSMHDNIAFVQHALDAGAMGYITKDSAADVLVTAVRAIAAGERYLDSGIAGHFSRYGAVDGLTPFDSLSKREFQIFCRVAEGKSAGAIALELSLSIKTVANYQTRIKEKLGLSSTSELIRMALQHGIIKM